MAPRIRGLTCGGLLAAQILTGCMSWHVEQVSPQALLDREHPSVIQVQERGGTKYVLDAPRVEGDSLTGTVGRQPVLGTATHVVRRIPLAAVERVAVRKPDVLATVMSVLLGAGVAFTALVYIALRNNAD